jgi:nucleolar pre-ribosomal-associated protein 1
VIHNKNITKTQKVRFFTGQFLNHIAALYNWNGITDVTPEKPESAAVSRRVTVRIRKLLSPILDL